MIRENLKVAQSQQKSYADKRRKDLSFEIGDFVYLMVSPMRGTRRFKVKEKLAPRFVCPFKIISCKGEVAYQLKLPPQLANVHDVFHVSQLKKCLRVSKKSLDMAERVTCSKVIKMCKVQWSYHTEDEATWEHEEELRAVSSELFLSAS
jgi:hypothetical protein